MFPMFFLSSCGKAKGSMDLLFCQVFKILRDGCENISKRRNSFLQTNNKNCSGKNYKQENHAEDVFQRTIS